MNKYLLAILLVAITAYPMGKKLPVIQNDMQLMKAEFNQKLMENGVKVDKMIGAVANVQSSMKADIDSNAKAVMGIDKSVSDIKRAGRDINTSTVNESKIFIAYVESQNKLNKVFQYIIGLLIVQLVGLLTLYVKKDWDLGKRMEESRERADTRYTEATEKMDKMQMDLLNRIIK